MDEKPEMHCWKIWKIEEEVKLLKNIRDNKTYEDIAKDHNRSIGSIISRLKRIIKININIGNNIEKIAKNINISEDKINEILNLNTKIKEDKDKDKNKILNTRIKEDKNKKLINEISYLNRKIKEDKNENIIEQIKDNKIEIKNNFFVYNELKCLKSKTILIFDLETTGIPNTEKEKIPAYKLYKSFEKTNIYDDINIVQIGWCFIEDFNIDNIDEYEIKSEIRKPLNFTIPEESIKFHGIDDEKAKNEGLKLSKILNDNDFYGMIEKCDYIIAHNAEYDYNVLMSEIKKLGYNDLYNLLLENKNKIICTYKGTNGKYSLKRLYNITFGCDFKNAHTADGDVKALLEIISGKISSIKLKEEIEKDRVKIEYDQIMEKILYQESDETKKMFKKDKKLWENFHKNRDIIMKNNNPINKIIDYLETKKNKKLKILDLGCGRNIIKSHFEDYEKLDIIGYDYVSYNDSIACDIRKLPDDEETVDICIFSQSLIGVNWKDYIDEAIRVLRHNGEIIISESIERYVSIKEYIQKLGLHIKMYTYDDTNRWCYLYVLNDKVIEKVCER